MPKAVAKADNVFSGASPRAPMALQIERDAGGCDEQGESRRRACDFRQKTITFEAGH
jgi:hypothetical protein